MSDSKLLVTAFSLFAQPVVLAENDRIAYMNPAAVTLAEKDLTGKPVSLLIPSHILNTQADCFVASAFIGTKSCIVKVSVCDEYKVFAFSIETAEERSNDLFFTQLRDSLSTIKFTSSRISVMAEDENNEQLGEYASRINRSYYRIKNSVDKVTVLKQFARGELPFRPELIDISELYRDTIDAVRSMVEGLDLNISFRAEEKVNIVADRELVQQLLMNLLSNSLISINSCKRSGKISVALTRTAQNLIISVDDNGTGIERPELAMSFDRYRHEENLSQLHGAGMGLAVVRAIAQLHKGTVIIESRGEDMGTSVRVMLSLDVPASKHLKASDSAYQSVNMRRILTELSNCLPLECYSEKFED